MKYHKNIGFPSNIDPDPLKFSQSYQQKASIQWWVTIGDGVSLGATNGPLLEAFFVAPSLHPLN